MVIHQATHYTSAWLKGFHVGFEVGTVDEVRRLYDKFKTEGVATENEVFDNARGSRFFCRALGGAIFEINTRADIHGQRKGTL